LQIYFSNASYLYSAVTTGVSLFSGLYSDESRNSYYLFILHYTFGTYNTMFFSVAPRFIDVTCKNRLVY